MSEEKIYQFNDYILSYDKSLNDRSCLIISKIQNGEMYLMGELFDGSADVVSMILDRLQTTVNACKQENTELKDNRNKLKEWLEEKLRDSQYELNDIETPEVIQMMNLSKAQVLDNVLDKIQEIEGGTNV